MSESKKYPSEGSEDSQKRNQEWESFRHEAFNYSHDLAGVEKRVCQRIGKRKFRRRTFVSSLSTVAAAMLFILLVNTSHAFAYTIAHIPVLGQLAEYVKFDKSLSMAIENEYVQEVAKTSRDGDTELHLPYVLADEKNLVLFFQLPKDFALEDNTWVNIWLKKMRNAATGEKIEGYSYSSSSINLDDLKENHGFMMQRFHFSEGTLPSSIEITVELEVETHGEILHESNLNTNYFEDDFPKPVLDNLGTFTFQIEFEEFAKPIKHEFHKEYSILGQTIVLEEMNIFPTGTEVHFTFPEDNSAWIKGLELTVEENGRPLLVGKNGISATFDPDYQWMTVFIESDYFRKPRGQQNLVINGIRLLDKEEKILTVDINKKTITPAIEGLTLDSVEIKNGKAKLVFETVTAQNGGFGMFSPEYKDSQGNIYELSGEGTTTVGKNSMWESKTIMNTIITTVAPEDGILIFERSLTPKEILEPPLEIPLPHR